MRKILFLLALILFSIAAYGQGNKKDVVYYTGAPAGTCSERWAIDRVTGKGYSCVSGVWTLMAAGATTPGGSTTQIQYNLSNAFAGDSGLTYTGTGATGVLTVGASVRVAATGAVGFGITNNTLKYIDGAGFAFTDGTTSTTTTFNAQSLTGNHTFILPNQDGTICTTGGICTGYQPTIIFGTGVQTALGVNIGSAGAPVLLNGAGGTPSSIALNNATALPDSALSANVPLLNAANTFLNNLLVSGSSFGLTGNISGAGIFGTSGIRYKNVPGTLTDTTSTGTVATNYTNVFGANTLAATLATTITNDFNTYFKDPIAGTNVTLTNKWALGADSLKIGTSNPLTVSNAGVLTAIAPVLGTPTTLVGTNITGTAAGLTAGNVTTNANLTGVITSVGNATSIASQTGTGSKFVVDTSPTLVTPNVTTGINDTNGNQMLKFIATASAVDGFTFTNAATANPATVDMAATGSDSNISLSLTPKGSGKIVLPASAVVNFGGGGTSMSFSNDATRLTLGATTSINTGTTFQLATGSTFRSAVHFIFNDSGGSDNAGLKNSSSGLLTVTNGSTGSGSIAPQTAGGGTSGTNALPFSSTYIGNAATNNIQLTGTATSAKVATLPDNTGTIGELNLAQSWTAIQTVSNTTDATSTTTGALIVSGGAAIRKRVFIDGITQSSGLQTAVLCQSSGGEMIADTVACLASSARFKNRIKPLDVGLNEILKFRPVSFFYKPEGIFANNQNFQRGRVGLIAEDVAKVDQRLVGFEKDNVTPRTVAYEQIVPVLIKGMQEEQAEIEQLKKNQQTEIETLKSQVAKLSRAIANQKRIVRHHHR